MTLTERQSLLLQMACKVLNEYSTEHSGFVYDGTECDLACLAEDIIDEFDLPAFGDDEFDEGIRYPAPFGTGDAE